MFIQLHDVITDENPKIAGLFILTSHNKKIKFLFLGHLQTMICKNTHPLIKNTRYNRQAAIEAINTHFKYTGLSLHIERIAVSEKAKEHAKNIDTIKKQAKRKREQKTWN